MFTKNFCRLPPCQRIARPKKVLEPHRASRAAHTQEMPLDPDWPAGKKIAMAFG